MGKKGHFVIVCTVTPEQMKETFERVAERLRLIAERFNDYPARRAEIIENQKRRLEDFAKQLSAAIERNDDLVALMAQMSLDRKKEIEKFKLRLSKLRQENTRARIAVNDSIRRPMGVVPDSAIEFYNPIPRTCPRCGNGDGAIQGNFCIICGLPVQGYYREVQHGL